MKSFLEQYGEYALAKEDDPKLSIRYTPFVLSINSSVFGIPPLDDKPLIITNQAIKHIAAKHEAKIKTLSNLATEIKENALDYEDPVHKGHLDIVLAIQSSSGSRMIAVVDAKREQNGVSIVSVRTVHGKRELNDQIMESLDKGLAIYVNKRTGDWLRDPQNMPAEAELSSETSNRLLKIFYERFSGKASAEEAEADKRQGESTRGAGGAHEAPSPAVLFAAAQEAAGRTKSGRRDGKAAENLGREAGTEAIKRRQT